MEASFNTSHGTGKVVRQALSESNNLIKTASDNRIINLIKQRLYDSSDSNKSMDEYKDGSDKKIIDHFNICLTSSDLFRLYPGGWLNDNLIDFYFEMLQEYVNAKASSCISLVKFWSTQLFSKISSCGISQVYRWSKLPIKNFNKIVIPVNLGNSHWVLCTIWIAEKKIEYYDSFVKLQNFSHKVFTLLFDWLGGEYMKLDEIVRAEDWTFFIVSGPQQTNGVDCGVFTCMAANFIADDLPLIFNQSHMELFRRKILHDICSCKLSYVDIMFNQLEPVVDMSAVESDDVSDDSNINSSVFNSDIIISNVMTIAADNSNVSINDTLTIFNSDSSSMPTYTFTNEKSIESEIKEILDSLVGSIVLKYGAEDEIDLQNLSIVDEIKHDASERKVVKRKLPLPSPELYASKQVNNKICTVSICGKDFPVQYSPPNYSFYYLVQSSEDIGLIYSLAVKSLQTEHTIKIGNDFVLDGVILTVVLIQYPSLKELKNQDLFLFLCVNVDNNYVAVSAFDYFSGISKYILINEEISYHKFGLLSKHCGSIISKFNVKPHYNQIQKLPMSIQVADRIENNTKQQRTRRGIGKYSDYKMDDHVLESMKKNEKLAMEKELERNTRLKREEEEAKQRLKVEKFKAAAAAKEKKALAKIELKEKKRKEMIEVKMQKISSKQAAMSSTQVAKLNFDHVGLADLSSSVTDSSEEIEYVSKHKRIQKSPLVFPTPNALQPDKLSNLLHQNQYMSAIKYTDTGTSSTTNASDSEFGNQLNSDTFSATTSTDKHAYFESKLKETHAYFESKIEEVNRAHLNKIEESIQKFAETILANPNPKIANKSLPQDVFFPHLRMDDDYNNYECNTRSRLLASYRDHNIVGSLIESNKEKEKIINNMQYQLNQAQNMAQQQFHFNQLANLQNHSFPLAIPNASNYYTSNQHVSMMPMMPISNPYYNGYTAGSSHMNSNFNIMNSNPGFITTLPCQTPSQYDHQVNATSGNLSSISNIVNATIAVPNIQVTSSMHSGEAESKNQSDDVSDINFVSKVSKKQINRVFKPRKIITRFKGKK